MMKLLSLPKRPRRMLAGLGLLTVSVGWCRSTYADDHGRHADPGHGGHSTHAASESSSSAINLGEYRIRSYYPVQAQKSIVRFVLYASAPPDRLAEAKELAAHRQHKIRDQVTTATRMMPLAEFDDPDLKRFRRRIVLRLRRALPELPIEDLYISNFELQVQSL